MKERAACWAVSNMLTPASSLRTRLGQRLNEATVRRELSESVACRKPIDFRMANGSGGRERTDQRGTVQTYEEVWFHNSTAADCLKYIRTVDIVAIGVSRKQRLGPWQLQLIAERIQFSCSSSA